MVSIIEQQSRGTVSSSQLGRYDIVKLALKWIILNKQNEDYRKLTQTEIINKALNDVLTNVVTTEKIDELCKRK
jgi:hypothetical protein